LEDLGNLVANELFGGCAITEELENSLPERIAEEIEALRAKRAHLTIVTNEVFSGGKDYEGETLTYLRILAKLSRLLAGRADYVVEVVCGLPDVLKRPDQETEE
jgi:adenosylcobinamide kinase/adenosylcobinamide-phosphate guanylyltransferase